MPNLTAEHYDKEKFKEFLTGHSLPKLRDKSCVLVVGPMGAGKSTTIGIQLGAIYGKDTSGPGYKLTYSQSNTPSTADGFISRTLNIGAYEDAENQLTYLDTAGLNENRGKEERLWARNNLDLLFSIVRDLKAVVVVMSYDTFKMRGIGFSDLSDNLSKITMRDPIFHESMLFVITNGYQGGEKITKDQLIGEASRMLRDTQQRKQELFNRLERLYPLNVGQRLLGAVGGALPAAHADGEEERIRFDIERISEEDRHDLERLQAVQKLLQTFTQSAAKLILSYPDGAEACQELRRELLQKIHLTPTITRDTLERIRNERVADSRLLFTEVLGSVASFYLPNLNRESELLESLRVSYDRHKAFLDAAQRDWAIVKGQLIEIKRRDMTDKRISIGLKETEINRLSGSRTEMLHQERHILRECSKGFVGFWKRLFSAARAEYKYNYEGQAFVRYHFEELNHNFDAYTQYESPGEGRLSITFKSHNGNDLNLKVKVLVYEKDLPSTRERLQVLRQELDIKRGELTNLEQELTALETVRTREELDREILRESQALQDALNEVMQVFRTPLHLGVEKSNWQVVNGLASLFKLLEQVGAMHPGLSPAIRDSIHQYLACNRVIEEALMNPYFIRMAPNIVDVHKVAPLGPGEDVPPTPVLGILPWADGVVNLATTRLRTLSVPSFFKTRQLESGISIALLAALLLWDSTNLRDEGICDFSPARVCFIFTITVGVFIALSRILTKLDNFATRVAEVSEEHSRRFQNRVGQVLQEIEVEARKATVTASDLSIFATQRITERFNFNVDARADIRGNIRTLAEITGFRL